MVVGLGVTKRPVLLPLVAQSQVKIAGFAGIVVAGGLVAKGGGVDQQHGGVMAVAEVAHAGTELFGAEVAEAAGGGTETAAKGGGAYGNGFQLPAF